MVEIQGTLASVVGATGEVNRAYGGFSVSVTQPLEFPWEQVFRLLLALQHDVWVNKQDDRLVIRSKPHPP